MSPLKPTPLESLFLGLAITGFIGAIVQFYLAIWTGDGTLGGSGFLTLIVTLVFTVIWGLIFDSRVEKNKRLR